MPHKKAPEELRFAAIAVDIVVFGIKDDALHVLLDGVNRPPYYTNIDAFIGGLIEIGETADRAAERHLADKVGLKDIYTEQLYTFSEVHRDKRNRVISVAYVGFVRPDTIASYSHETAHWCPVSKLPALAYDHRDVYKTAINRLRGKLAYTTVAQYLLPQHFTLTQLQNVYEIILHTDFDKRNFRKKILALDVVKETGGMQEGVKNRPAALYTFKKTGLQELALFF